MKSNRLLGSILLIITLSLTACNTNKPLNILETSEITALGDECQEISSMMIEAWDTRNSENLLDIFTDDIIHYDGYPAYVGLDTVTGMAELTFRLFSEMEMAAGDAYTSADKCVGTWITWGTEGMTEENPGLEFDLLETRDSKISFWRLFYDEQWDAERIQWDFLNHYAETWSQGDPAAIKDLYAKNAEYEDTLLGVQIEGQRRIGKHVEQLLAKGANNWSITIPYGEEGSKFPYMEEIPFPSSGGVFEISVMNQDGSTCKIVAFLILTPDAEGLITKQETFYSTDSLIACGWAE